MKRIFSGLLAFIVLLACGCVGAQGNVYENRNVFYDDDPIMFAASAGGMLYILRDSGIYAVAPDGTETCVAQADAFGKRIDAFLSDGQSLYGLALDGAMSLTLLTDGSGNFANRLLFETDDYPGVFPQNPVVKNGKLYFMYADGAETPVAIRELATGKSQTVRLAGVRCFDVMADGRLIAMKQETRWPDVITSLIAVTPETGEAALWAEADTTQVLNRLAYDSATETAYLFSRSDIFAGHEGGALTRVDGFIAGDVISAALLASGAALVVDGTLVIRNFDAANSENARRLTILEPYGRGETYRSFLEANPNVDLLFAGPGDQTSEEKFVQDMTTHNTDIDIYILSDTNLLKNIKEKGYFVDMAQNPEIQMLVGQMYTPFRNALTMGTQIVAFPRETFFEMLCYHKATFEAIGITPPDTYEAYFDFCLEWLNSYAEAYPDITLNPFANSLSLQTLLTRYADERSRSGESLQYRTETMTRVIEKYQSVKKAMADQNNDASSGTPLFYNYFIPILGDEDEYAYLPLTFEKDAQTAISPQEGDFSYFVINPYAQNPKDALAFVAAFDEHRTEAETALLYQSADSAIESKTYKSEYARLQKELDALETWFATAEPDMRSDLEAQIKAQKERMAAYEKANRWAVSQSAITLYKAYADCLYISDFNPLASLRAGDENLFNEEEDISAAALLSALDSKISMILSEEGVR